MQMNAAPTLLKRIVDLLRAKQFLVFYAIGLYALDLMAPIASGWLRDHRPLLTLLTAPNSVPGDAILGHSAALVGFAIVYFGVAAWFEAGYLRSLVGHLHWRPRDGLQFGRILGLNVILVAIGWGFASAVSAAGPDSTAAQLIQVGWIAVAIMLVYAQYAVVVSGVSIVGAVVRSLQTVRRNLAVSVSLGALPFGVIAYLGLLVPSSGGFAAVLPSVIIVTAVMGSVGFLSDVVLIMVYIDAVEKRRIPHGS